MRMFAGGAVAVLLAGAACAVALSDAHSQAAPARTGAALYKTCVACHGARGQGTAMGPDLRGIAGRAAAQQEGFAYSGALRRSGKRWTRAELSAFLLNPQRAVPGNRMAYSGIGSERDAAALAAYLEALR
ncbi:MAG: c-type cytochrome [Sphingomonadales bacterium]|nr:MAG: c-type cytochrome [Sphingomonadales bacterium]